MPVLNLLEDKLTSKEGLKACQDFGKLVCEKLKKLPIIIPGVGHFQKSR